MVSGLPQHQVFEAYETYGYPAQGPLVITCEHASKRVPAPLRSADDDKAWLGTHWGFDIGARTVARSLIRTSGSFGVFSRFSRLVCDTNRDSEDATFIRKTVEGYPLSFNRRLDDQEYQRRIKDYHVPFHAAVDATLHAHAMNSGDLLLLSIHSFTPVWNRRLRPMDIGVLYDPYEPMAQRLAERIRAQGFVVALNQPYSAKKGLAYSVDRHGRNHHVAYLELEINQAIICTPKRALAVARRLGQALSQFSVRQTKR